MSPHHLLKKINRKCYHRHTIKAIRMLKESGFKVLIHIMPLLPDATPELDRQCLEAVAKDCNLKPDELKIYPTSVTTTSSKDETQVYTVIEKWYREGSAPKVLCEGLKVPAQFVLQMAQVDGGSEAPAAACCTLVQQLTEKEIATYAAAVAVTRVENANAHAALLQGGVVLAWGQKGHGGDCRQVQKQLVNVQRI